MTPIADTLGALTRCQEAGKIAHIGCCNFSASELRAACRSARIVSLQMPYNLIDRRIEDEAVASCADLQVAILAYSPLGQGFLSGHFGEGARLQPHDVRRRSVYFQDESYQSRRELLTRLAAVGQRHGRTAAQVALRWVLENPHVTSALVGIRTVAQAEEDVSIDWSLSRAECEWLTAAHPGIPESESLPRHAPARS
jgi:aryl-alcohol dehydrogenase-like predicted oxidoreductase